MFRVAFGLILVAVVTAMGVEIYYLRDRVLTLESGMEAFDRGVWAEEVETDARLTRLEEERGLLDQRFQRLRRLVGESDTLPSMLRSEPPLPSEDPYERFTIEHRVRHLERRVGRGARH